MLLIFSTLWIINLGSMIVETNTTRVRIFIIAITTTSMTINHRKKNDIFREKKIVTLISIQTISNEKQKNFRDKTENFMETKTNITYF